MTPHYFSRFVEPCIGFMACSFLVGVLVGFLVVLARTDRRTTDG